MANTAFEHSPTITVPGSGNSTDNAVVLWNGTTGNNFSNSLVTFNGVLLDIRNDDSAASEIRLYCDTGNSHYQAIRSGAHGGTSYTMILPHIPPTATQVLSTASISSNVAVLDWVDAATIVPTTIAVLDTTDASSYVGLWTDAAGDLAPKTDAALTYDASNGALTAVTFHGSGANLTGISAGISLAGTTSGNQITTVNSSTEINGEADLTFDGGTLLFGGSGENTIKVTTSTGTAPANIQIAGAAGGTGNGGANLILGEGALDGTTGDKAYRFSYLSNVDYFRFGSVESGDVFQVLDGTNDTKFIGNVVIGTAGKGIDFSAQTATSASGATTTAEILDHYEEGTFTPGVKDSSNNVPGSYQTGGQTGSYTRIGQAVFFSMRIAPANTTGMTDGNPIKVTGLPFANNGGVYSGACVGSASNMNLGVTTTSVSAAVKSGDTTIGLTVWDTTSGQTDLSVSEWGGNGDLTISGYYET